MIDVIIIIVLGLATWRISALLTREAGPFHMFEKLRELAGIEHDQEGNVQMIPHKFFAELLSCVWCNSIWAGTFWTIMLISLPKVAPWIALPFALSTLAILLDRHA